MTEGQGPVALAGRGPGALWRIAQGTPLRYLLRGARERRVVAGITWSDMLFTSSGSSARWTGEWGSFAEAACERAAVPKAACPLRETNGAVCAADHPGRDPGPGITVLAVTRHPGRDHHLRGSTVGPPAFHGLAPGWVPWRRHLGPRPPGGSCRPRPRTTSRRSRPRGSARRHMGLARASGSVARAKPGVRGWSTQVS